MSEKRTNETYEITAESPLLRPGLRITVRVSERYAAKAAARLLDVVRAINSAELGR